MYHRLGGASPAGDDSGEGWYAVDPGIFERHLDLFSEFASPVSFDETLLALEGKGTIPDRAVALTFDDGNASDHDFALAALRSRGLRAAFFITPEWVGRPGFLSWEQVRNLEAAGMTIGAHGLDHTLLDSLPDRELGQNLRGARKLLEAHLERAPETLSLPGGRGGPRALRAAREAGFRWVLGSVPRTVSPSRVPAELPRFAVRRRDSLVTLRGIVTQKRVSLGRALARHQLLEGVRGILGGKLYLGTRRLLGKRTA
jgi:peptidoglycan/xylan/chitin deacetylase (PgdA/CDA1 family)